MGPKVKKPPKNAFSFYLEDYAESQRKLGRQISMKVAAEECGPLWKELPEEERQHYGKIAAAYKVYSKDDKRNKFTSTGESYEEIERKQEEIRKKNEAADTEIKTTISNLDSELYEGIYVPGEMAISEFNLGDGVRRTFHRLLNPGFQLTGTSPNSKVNTKVVRLYKVETCDFYCTKRGCAFCDRIQCWLQLTGPIPFGYAFEAKQTIDEIHGLPKPPYEEGDSDFEGLRISILKFLEPGKLPSGKYPPLYTIENNFKASEYILSALTNGNDDEDTRFRVYHLHKMFFWLKNKCVEHIDDQNVGFPVISNAESELIKDVFRYAPGLSCSFHETSEDKYQNCSLSIVQRFAYIVCDHCCQYVGVELVPGKHCRPNADLEGGASRAGKSSVKSRSSPPPSEAAESEYGGKSSYGGNFSAFNWKKGPGSFLHEELESKFSALDVSSHVSRSSYNPSPSFADAAAQRPERRVGRGDADSSSDDENFQKVLSLGRGMSRRK